MGGILQVDTIQNNNTSTLITQTNTTTITIARSGQTVVIPSGTTFNASSASVNLPTGSVGISQLSATGTASSSTYLRGDNSWNAVSSDYVLLASSDASSSASVSFDGYFSSTYRNYKMIFSGLRMSTTNTNLNARLRTSNADITTSIYKNNNLFIQLDNASTNSAGSGYGGWNQSSILVQRGTNNGATYEGAGEATFYYPLSTTGYKQVKIECQYMWQDLTYFFFQQQFVQCDTTSALSGISIYPTSGTITSGNFKLYGIK